MVKLIYSDVFLEHRTGANPLKEEHPDLTQHPESPERLRAIVAALHQAIAPEHLEWLAPTPIAQRSVIPYLLAVHTRDYLEHVRSLSERGKGWLDDETPVCDRTNAVAQLAVSAWLDGVDLAADTGEPVFVLARPPGHHALPDRGMGFCVYANAAIAAFYALGKPDIERVAILDWDVHHGNGTQDIVRSHAQIAFCSLHQFPTYPGTGEAHDMGDYDNVLNVPLPPHSRLQEYNKAFVKQIIPFMKRFQPDLLIVSAGFDANAADPLEDMDLQPNDYSVLTNHCLQLNCPIVLGLEGGYAIAELAQSVIATVNQLI